MKCVVCKSEAEAICKFCGRAVCLKCASEKQYESGTVPKYFTQTAKSATVVRNAVWCTRCSVDAH